MHDYTTCAVNKRNFPREYGIWRGMLSRCNNPKNPNYQHYGARGIRVCERWNSFAVFFADMGHPPTSLHTLDRKDNNGNYEPGNCRWATRQQQSRNTRTNRLRMWPMEKVFAVGPVPLGDVVEFQGTRARLRDLAAERGLSPKTVRSRLRRGLTLERALVPFVPLP